MDAGHVRYQFGDFLLLPKDKQLLRNGTPVPLKPKAFQTLLLLVENHGHLIEKENFLRKLWPDSFVEEVSLAQNISQLRKILGATSDGGDYIETVPRVGYRFIAPVRMLQDEDKEPPQAVVVAVLPFEMMGENADREYLADGLTEEVIATLGQVDPERLHVIGRTSVMRYRGASKSLAEIGRELGAAFVLESSMRTEGGRIRVTSKLIRASDQVQNWSASYDAQPGSLLNFQRELSAAIAEQVRLRLSPERLETLKRRQTQNPEAYDAYLRGRHYWNHFTPGTTRRAVECFSRATDLDPQYALAWCGIADALSSAPIHADACPAEVWGKARTAVANALAAEPEIAEAQTSLGVLKFWLDWDWTAAEIAYRKALELDPCYSLAHRMLGILLAHQRDDAEARGATEKARSLDPSNAMHHALSAQVAFVTRDYTGALDYARQATITLDDFWIGHYQMAQAYERLEQYEQSLEALSRAAEFDGGNSKVISLRGYVLAKLSRKREALAVIGTLRSLAKGRYVPPYSEALVHAALGNTELVYQNLNRALEVHDVHLALLPADPKWDSMRAAPEFGALLEKAGLPNPVKPKKISPDREASAAQSNAAS